LKLRHQLFLLLLLSGILPLAISSTLLIRQNRELLETQEKSYLTRSARFLSIELSGFLADHSGQFRELGLSLVATPPEGEVESKLRRAWLTDYLGRYLADRSNVLVLRLLAPSGGGPQFVSTSVGAATEQALAEAFSEAVRGGGNVYRLVTGADDNRPLAVLTVPVRESSATVPRLFVQGVVRLRPMETLFQEEARGDVGVFLVDRRGELLWSEGSDEATDEGLIASSLVRDFVRFPVNLTVEYSLRVGGRERRLLARISPVPESGWGVVVHKPVASAFAVVREMVINAVLSTAVLVLLALAVAATVARKISGPIQRLAETSHEIAAGNFGKRVQVEGLWREIGDLAGDFNRMGDHVQQYVERLEKAARENRELFIGSMRAFVAAIDARDPYTRGHSERVAGFSRIVARFLGRDKEFQQQVWVGALLHDVGKIGIDDRILKKGGVLSGAEYEEMKEHTQIGVEIMSRFDLLHEMIPAIHWHHEAWNGKGYPDGLRGEQIPLAARIVAVADTFDAVTTSRPYQRAYDEAFAVETIRRLTGTRFDAKVVTAFLLAFEAGEVRSASSTSESVPSAAISAAV
jgi:putative nucleotidyltransferase with HDIG domain